jgi:biopolymer transport protein ExbD
MKSKKLFAVVLGLLIVFALSLPVMAQSTTQSTTTTTNDSMPAQTQSTTTTTQTPAY